MSKADDIFWREFGVILLLLFVFGLAMFFLARSVGGTAFEQAKNSERAIAARIAPVGQVRVGDPAKQTEAPVMQAAAPAAILAAAAKSGEEIYNGICMACHLTGAANAPKLGDKPNWETRAKTGIDALVQTVLKGKNAMPPKGGNPALSEEDIRRTVEFMLGKAGVSGQ